MSETLHHRTGATWRVVLVAALLLEMYIFYFIQNPATRVSLGVFLLAIVILASSRIELVAHIEANLPGRRPVRRFNRLRAQVVQFISGVQRMNWLTVDADNGVMDRDICIKEIDAIEDRMNILVKRIRQEAGR